MSVEPEYGGGLLLSATSRRSRGATWSIFHPARTVLLDATPLKADGEYLFDKNRALSELLGIWRPKMHSAGYRDYETLITRWLASWIRFWVAQPIIWYRALDLEFVHFGEDSKAA